jgi:nitrate reductase delta subunit
MDSNVYDLLAGLLVYPTREYGQKVEESWRALAGIHPEAAGELADFTDKIQGLSLEEQQELFVRTFDLNPVCVLEVGWHLYGDTYDRGEFLVKMRQEMRRCGLSGSSELPDHMTHALTVQGRLEREEAERFAATAVLPALEKMLAGLEGKKSPFEQVLRAIRLVVADCHPRVLDEAKHD